MFSGEAAKVYYAHGSDPRIEHSRHGGTRVNRPLVWVAAAMAAGIYGAAEGLLPGAALPAALCAAGVLMTVFSSGRIAMRIASVMLCALAAGAMVWHARHVDRSGDAVSRCIEAHPEVREWTLEGTVRLADLEASDPSNLQFVLDVERVELPSEIERLRGSVVVRWTLPNGQVHASERVRVTGRLTTAIAHVNPGVDSYEDYARAQGIHSAMKARGPAALHRVAPGQPISIRYWASRLRLAETERLRAVVPPSALPFVYTVLLGYRTSVSQEQYEAFVASGTAHILSVSGVHMAMVYVTAAFVLGIVSHNRRRNAWITIGVIIVFALISGMRPAALRSAIMIIVYLFADLFDRERDAPTSLSVSALLLLPWRPDMLFDAGFQLSFLSVASILILTEPIIRGMGIAGADLRERAVRLYRVRFAPYRPPALRKDAPAPHGEIVRLAEFLAFGVRGTLATSIAVQVLPTPLAVGCFHVLPFLAPLANLVIVPLGTAVLWLCLLASVALPVSSHVALLFGHALAPVVGLIQWTVAATARPSFSHVVLSAPTRPALVCWLIAALCVIGIAHGNRRRVWFAAACAAMIAAAGLWRPLWPAPEAVFLDVGHGDATFIRSPQGATLLVDGGDRSALLDVGHRFVSPFLRANHVTRLDWVAMSHPDRDHLGGLFDVVRSFSVGEVLMGGVPRDEPLEKDFLDLCAERGVPVRRLFAGDRLERRGLAVQVLSPPESMSAAESVNNTSLVLRVAWEGTTILLPGDIEQETESILSRSDCRAAILKVPHHGSQTSSTGAFVQAVNPEECIVSTGGERGREPVDPTVLERYLDAGVNVWRTDVDGGIRIAPVHGILKTQGEREARGYR